MDQGWVHNPNVTPSSYPMKFCLLFCMVAFVEYIPQKHFLIGLFAKSDTFSLAETYSLISQPISISPNNIPTTYTSYHTYSSGISHFLYESLGICYQRYSTMGKNSHKTRSTLTMGVMRYFYQFQLSLHKTTIMTTS